MELKIIEEILEYIEKIIKDGQAHKILISLFQTEQINHLNKLNFVTKKNLMLEIESGVLDQTYRISKHFYNSNINSIISINKFFQTKYDKILLYEYYNIIFKDGYLLIVTESQKYDQAYNSISSDLRFYKNNKIFDFLDSNITDNYCFFLLKKHNLERPQSCLKKWTFGFITNGTKDEFINKQIQRIADLKLLEYQVVICGTYKCRISNSCVKYIHFTEYDNKGWITKKKNLICESAMYENVVILHDRYIIPLDFLEKMEQWGNDFDLLGAKQIYYPSPLNPTPVPCQDWMTYTRPLEAEKKDRSCDSVGILEPQDWDQWCYITGGVYIVKRSLMLKVPQDESLFWNEVEDIKFCHDFTKAGYLVRFNPYLEFESVSYRWPALVIQYSHNPHQLGTKTTSKETLLYWYFYLLDYLLVYKEIKTALHQLGSDFLQKIKSVVVNNENLELHQANLSTVKNIRELNSLYIDILNNPLVSQTINDIDRLTQIHLAFNLVLGRRPSPYEEYIWGSKNQLFVNMVSDLLYETEFQYRIRTLARSTHVSKTGDILVLRCLSVVKPLILLVIMTSINLTRTNLKRLKFVKKIIKKFMFYIS